MSHGVLPRTSAKACKIFYPFSNHPETNMRTRLLTIVGLCLIFCVSSLNAQSRTTAGAPAFASKAASESTSNAESRLEEFFNGKSNRLPASVVIPNSTFVGVSTKYHTQTNRGALHNIQVDPSNPSNIHAVIMAAPNVTDADTVGGSYPSRNIFYTFSHDAGVTWSTPKAVSSIRAGFPDMLLYKRGSNYVPVIGAHRYVSASSKDFISALYVEMGNPGDGNFKETLADRNATVVMGARDILWPSIAISPDNQTVYMAASLNPSTTDKNWYPMEIGSFTLDATGSATWNGWKNGPNGPIGTEGQTSAGEYVLRVSPSGKLGVAWDNYDVADQDLGLYFAESKDAGVTWVSNYQPIWKTLDLSSTATDGTNVFLQPTNGLDMFYDGESVKLVTAMMQDAELSSNNVYLPNSGGIAFWNGDTNSQATFLLSRIWTGSLDTGSFPLWNTGLFEPQGTVGVVYPTIGRSTIPGKWSVFYQGWQNDLEQVNDTLIYPYSGIYEMRTTDNGATWSKNAPVLENNADGTGLKVDYRFPEVSTFNPTVAENFAYNMMYAADTAAGLFENAGFPGFDEVGWYYKPILTAGVAQSQPTSFSLAQNYPNPFNPSTTIKFNLVKSANVELTVTDVLGRTVATLLNKQVAAGQHSVKFDATSISSGVYSYTMKANGQSYTQRMVLSK